MIEYKNAEKKYQTELKKMWQEIFEDKAEYINLFFDNMYKDEYCFIAIDNEKVVAMMYFLPATMVRKHEKIEGRYVYAVATDKNYRGRGIMSALESYASNVVALKGVEFLTLVPATESLFSMYEKIGYKTYEYHKKLEFNPHEYTRSDNVLIEKISFDSLDNLRQNFLNRFEEYIYIDDNEYAKKELLFLGAKIYKIGDDKEIGYVICFVNDEKLQIKECALSERLLKKSIKNLSNITNCGNIEVKSSQNLFKGINKIPYSMVKWLKTCNESNTLSVYQNLMLD